MLEDLRDFVNDYREKGSTNDPYLQNFLWRFADKIEFRFKALEKELKEFKENKTESEV